MKLIAALTLGLLLTSCEFVPVYDTPLMAFHGQKQMDVIMHSNLVESFRLDPDSLGSREKGERFAGYLVVKAGPNLSQRQQLELLELVINEDNYGFEVDKPCEFAPIVGLRLRRTGGEMVAMLVSFECNEWQFQHEDRVMNEEFRRSTVRPGLVNLARALFPGDLVIRRLHAD